MYSSHKLIFVLFGAITYPMIYLNLKVLFEESSYARKTILNRPHKLNSLRYEMVRYYFVYVYETFDVYLNS